MNKQSMIHLNLEFYGALIPVETDEQGRMVVPIKPISDAIGLEWTRQHKKLSDSYLSKRLGTCIVLLYYAGQHREMVCIRLDRVAAFLNTVNPENVRGQGNASAADFLEAKHAEWDDLIDAYERGYGILAKRGKTAARKPATYNDFLNVTRAKGKATSEPERKALDFMARKIASELGAAFDEGTANSAS